MIEITVDKDTIERKLGSLKNRASLVMARAANRAMTTGKKVIKSETAKRYFVRQKDVESILKTTRAKTRYPYVRLIYKDDHKNLVTWNKRGKSVVTPYAPVSFSSGNPDPEVYYAQVMKGGGKRALEGKRKPFVQIARKSTNVALFRRTGEGNKIEGVAGPALPQVVGNKEVMERLEKEARETMEKRIEHEIDWILEDGKKGKGGVK